MKALVTGAAGFIGSHLAERLLRKGSRVTCLVRSASSRQWLHGLAVEVVVHDLANPCGLSRRMADVDVVFHAAGVTKGFGKTDYFRGNLQATENLLHACRRSGADHLKFIHVSSLSAVGPSADGRPLTEEASAAPVSWYGQSKLMAEEAVRRWGRDRPAIVIRPPIVYGPRDRDFLQYFKSVTRGLYPMTGRGLQRVSLIHVHDLAEGIVQAAEAECAVGQTYFMSGDGEYSWLEVGEILSRVLDRKILRIPLPNRLLQATGTVGTLVSRIAGRPMVLNADKVKEAMQPNWVCSSKKAHDELGFHPAMPLEKGLASTALWFRRAGWM